MGIIAKIEDVNVRGYRNCGFCMFYSSVNGSFCQCRERSEMRDHPMQHTFCRWNLSWDEFCQVYDPYIM